MLACWEAIWRHQPPVVVTARAGGWDIWRVDVTAGVIRPPDRVRVVAVRACWRIAVALPQQELSVPAGLQLRHLVSGKAVLTHLIGVRVTRCADLHRPCLGGHAYESASVGRLDFERRRITAVAIVTLDAAVRVHSR